MILRNKNSLFSSMSKMESFFYKNIAPYYDSIFILGKNEKTFYDSFSIDKSMHIAEIGCGTGELALYFADRGAEVIGIDSDPWMVEQAAKKIQNKKNIRIIESDMLDTEKYSDSRFFDILFCMGNTLAHLGSGRIIEAFLLNAKKMMSTKSLFVFQLLNYKRILTRNIRNLPVIENKEIRFERRYTSIIPSEIIFESKLLVKKNNESFIQSTKLFPLTIDVLNPILKNTGLKISGLVPGIHCGWKWVIVYTAMI